MTPLIGRIGFSAALALLVEAHGVWLLDTTIHPLTGWLTFALAAVVLFFIAEHEPRGKAA